METKDIEKCIDILVDEIAALDSRIDIILSSNEHLEYHTDGYDFRDNLNRIRSRIDKVKKGE